MCTPFHTPMQGRSAIFYQKSDLLITVNTNNCLLSVKCQYNSAEQPSASGALTIAFAY